MTSSLTSGVVLEVPRLSQRYAWTPTDLKTYLFATSFVQETNPKLINTHLDTLLHDSALDLVLLESPSLRKQVNSYIHTMGVTLLRQIRADERAHMPPQSHIGPAVSEDIRSNILFQSWFANSLNPEALESKLLQMVDYETIVRLKREDLFPRHYLPRTFSDLRDVGMI